ncbi:MAG: autotransporter-associated beta strand repeat-containing protein [Pseudomonadota bacterium]
MNVSSFKCTHTKLNKAVLMLSAGLLLGAGEGEASTTYPSLTFSVDSPSLPGNTGVYYAVRAFQVSTTNTYCFTLSGASNLDNISSANINIYSGSFDPLYPNSNISSSGLSSGDSATLSSGPRYYAVYESYADTYTLAISPAITLFSTSDLAGASYSGDLKIKGNIISTGSTASVTASSTSSNGQSYVYAMNNTIVNFTKMSSYNLTLYGQNSYAGSTTISAGTLSLANSSIPSTSQINMSGGILGAAASFTLPNAIVLNNASNTIDSQGQNLVLSGNITGNYGLIVQDSVGSSVGSVSLTGTNSYSGTTTVNSGILSLSSAPNANQITFNGGSFQAGGTFSLSNAISFSSATNFDTNGYNVTLTGGIIGSGGLTKIGVGVLTLDNSVSGGDTQTGIITVNAGTFAIGSQVNDISDDPSISLGGGTFRSTASFNLTKNIGLTGNSAIDPYGNTLTYTGTVSGSNQLEINDSAGSAGICDVTGGTCSFTGGLKLTSGIYKIDTVAKMGTGTSVLNGGTLRLTQSITSSVPAISVAAANSVINTGSYTLNLGTVTATASSNQIEITGGGLLDMTNATTSSFIGGMKITNGTMLINAAYAGTGGMTLNGGTLKLAASVSSFPAIAISNNSTIDTNGSGYTLTVSGGALTGTSGKLLTIAGGGTMALTSSSVSALAGAGVSVTANSTLSASNITNQLSGAAYLQLAAGTTLKVTGSGTLPCGLVL